ncbi:transposase, partial [Pedobacter helvus]
WAMIFLKACPSIPQFHVPVRFLGKNFSWRFFVGFWACAYRGTWSAAKDCKDCPLRAECCGRATKFKKLDDSIHKAFYDEMHEKLNHNPNYTRFLAKRRSSRVEPVLGTLLNYHNMKRVNTRGIENANKHVLMAALTYNLKKYLKFISKKVRRNAQILDLPRGKWWFFENRIDLAYLSSN